MNREQIQQLTEQNNTNATAREIFASKIAQSQTTGASVLIPNFEDLKDLVLGEVAAAKIIGLYKLFPCQDIPVCDKNGNEIYSSRRIIFSRLFERRRNNKYSGRSERSEQQYVTLYANGEVEHVSSNIGNVASETVSLVPHTASISNPFSLTKEEFDTFNERWNGVAAAWAIPSLVRKFNISQAIQTQLFNRVRMYFANTSLRQLLRDGMEGLELDPTDFCTLVDNAIAQYGWTSECQTNDLTNYLTKKFHADLATWPDDIVTWDDPMRHPFWKKVTMLELFDEDI